MKLFSLLLLSFSLTFISISQESNTHCSKIKNKTNSIIKSATLTVSQIAETEKYDVHYYALDLEMTNLSTTLSGSASIMASCRVPLDTALIELYSTLNISSIELDGTPISFYRSNNVVKIPVNKNENDVFTLNIFYSGTPPTAATNPLGGSGMTNDFSPSWGNQVTWSLSEPFSAYEWWPCKQSLTDKADSCAISITVPSNCKAGSNGILKATTDLGNGKTRYDWKHNHPIDYYLLSVAVAEYVDYSVYANPVGAPAPILVQNFIYNNPNTLPNFQQDIDETVDFIELFSELYGLYPFADEKYGHCMAPLSGGMEHQTMTTQGWFDPGLTSHELGHQWWGDYVTCASWADIWINEGFASYSEYLMKENLHPNQRAQHMLDVHDNVMSQIYGSVYVLDTLNDGRIFDGRLTYDKGSAIIHTFRYLINNDSLFFNGLKNFLSLHANSTATGEDFKTAMMNYTNIDFSQQFDEWYYGEGYPTYSVKWNTQGNDLLVELTESTSISWITPLFTNPVDIKFSRTGASDTIIRFPITANWNGFQIANLGNVTNVVAIDPMNWIVNKNGTIVKDPNLTAGIISQEAFHTLVYPNPAKDVLCIHAEIGTSFEIIDLFGRVLLQADAQLENNVLPISNLANGNYLLRAKHSGLNPSEIIQFTVNR